MVAFRVETAVSREVACHVDLLHELRLLDTPHTDPAVVHLDRFLVGRSFDWVGCRDLEELVLEWLAKYHSLFLISARAISAFQD